jgi:hypothetical protein
VQADVKRRLLLRMFSSWCFSTCRSSSINLRCVNNTGAFRHVNLPARNSIYNISKIIIKLIHCRVPTVYASFTAQTSPEVPMCVIIVSQRKNFEYEISVSAYCHKKMVDIVSADRLISRSCQKVKTRDLAALCSQSRSIHLRALSIVQRLLKYQRNISPTLILIRGFRWNDIF